MGKDPIRGDYDSFREAAKRDYDSFRDTAKKDLKNFSNSTEMDSDDFFKEFNDFRKKAKTEVEEFQANAAKNVKKFNEKIDEEEAFREKRRAARAAQKTSTGNSDWVEVQGERPVEFKTNHGPVYTDEKIKKIQENAADSVKKFNKSVDAKAAGNEYVTEKGVKYKVTEKGVEMSGNAAALGNIDRLMPRMYEIKDNKTYACGPVRGTIYDAAKMAAQAEMQNTMLGQEVYNDMKKRVANGESLKDAEKNFMTKHEKDLKDFTLEMTPDGKLKQINPKAPMQITPTPVKDAASLPKQVEKDIKTTAQMQQQMAMSGRGMGK